MQKQIAALTVACLCLPAMLMAGGRQSTVSRVESGDIGRRVDVIGVFGMPLGKWLTIEGVRPASMPGKGGMHETFGSDFRVDRLNGQVLRQPVYITVGNIRQIPADTPCTFSGYETGGMVGMPEDALLHTGHRKPDPHSANMWGWTFVVRFVVVKLVRPTSVHVQAETSHT